MTEQKVIKVSAKSAMICRLVGALSSRGSGAEEVWRADCCPQGIFKARDRVRKDLRIMDLESILYTATARTVALPWKRLSGFRI